MDTKRSYAQEADWYERKVQSQAEEIEELKAELADLGLRCKLQEQKIGQLELLIDNPNLDKGEE